MPIDRSLIVEMFQRDGDERRARLAAQALPEVVEPRTDAGLLSWLGLDPRRLELVLDVDRATVRVTRSSEDRLPSSGAGTGGPSGRSSAGRPDERETHVQIDKSQIIDLLRKQGDDDKAAQADQELPSQVDTDKDAGLLSKLGLEPQDLIAKLSGGGGLGGMLGR